MSGIEGGGSSDFPCLEFAAFLTLGMRPNALRMVPEIDRSPSSDFLGLLAVTFSSLPLRSRASSWELEADIGDIG